ncbi:hypothetical protein CAPTEDRAFT_200132 [Capitella teleta]|uniref:G-protein coupled receptors family 1 profile domain-containing protein n=1 Tax=Capitella teleta TaxID=283909 RepID=R7V3E7_CAPTE|nr:hypothetical protein CAPTEDRAFT_200132 [Capitella teleta]|eukprot:ELU13074.1 hypothetical protein CAPTEDRAFT_200132 [Capitella teleta]
MALYLTNSIIPKDDFDQDGQWKYVKDVHSEAEHAFSIENRRVIYRCRNVNRSGLSFPWRDPGEGFQNSFHQAKGRPNLLMKRVSQAGVLERCDAEIGSLALDSICAEVRSTQGETTCRGILTTRKRKHEVGACYRLRFCYERHYKSQVSPIHDCISERLLLSNMDNQTSTLNGVATNTAAPEPILSIYPEATAARIIDQYGLGINSFLTIIGNALIIVIIISRPKMRGLSMYVYMMALAVADMIFSLVGMPGRLWMTSILNRDLPSADQYYCKIWLFLFNTSEGSSSWVLACMSCERCIAILLPLKARMIISRKVTCWVLFIVHVGLIGVFSSGFVLTGINTKGFCTYDNNLAADVLRVHLKPFCVLYIPSGIIFICNVILVVVLIRAQITRKAMNVSSEKDTTYSTAAMLVVVSITFFVLKAPRQLYGSSNWPRTLKYELPSRRNALYRLFLSISIWLGFFNHCVNIFLYVVSNKQFKIELVRLVRGILGKKEGLNYQTSFTRSSAISTHDQKN